MSASLELNFFYKTKNIDRYQLSFQKDIQIIKEGLLNSKIEIPESEFKYNKDKHQMSIKLFREKSDTNEEYYFNVYYGENAAYVQLDELHCYSYEIILRNIDNLHIRGSDNDFTKLDSMGNKDKKRLVLINYGPAFLIINEINLDLNQITKTNCIAHFPSNQLSELDFKTNKFIVKPMKNMEDYNYNFLLKNKDKYKEFAEELNSILECKESIYQKKIDEIKIRYNDLASYKFIYFIKAKEYLEKIFDINKNSSIEIFYNYFLLLFFYEQDELFKSQPEIAKNYINIIKNITNDIQKNPDISMFEKISAVNALILKIGKLENLNDLKNLNIKYYFYSKKFENSILDKVIKFFDKFIETLNEKSDVYQDLLFLDTGYGYYNHEKVYTYDLTNLEMLKPYLREIIPKFFIFCYMNDNSTSFITPEFYGIVFNEKFLIQNYKDMNEISLISYDKPINIQEPTMKEIYNDIAANIVIYLLMEMTEDKKYSLVEPGIDIPKKILNKENKLIELKYCKEKDKNNNMDVNSEYILSSNNNRGDSGNFLEFSYGKIGNDLLMKLLCQMKNKGKLIERADLFTDDVEKLKKFVILRMFLENNNINYDFINNMSIEDEIVKMESLVSNYKPKDNGIKVTEDKKRDKNEYLNKKRNAQQNLDNQEKPENKKPKLDLMNFIENIIIKKESENVKDNEENLSFNERIKGKTHKEVVEMSRKRVLKRFNFKYDENLRDNLIKTLKKLNSDDPYYNDLLIVIGDLRRIV